MLESILHFAGLEAGNARQELLWIWLGALGEPEREFIEAYLLFAKDGVDNVDPGPDITGPAIQANGRPNGGGINGSAIADRTADRIAARRCLLPEHR